MAGADAWLVISIVAGTGEYTANPIYAKLVQ